MLTEGRNILDIKTILRHFVISKKESKFSQDLKLLMHHFVTKMLTAKKMSHSINAQFIAIKYDY